jgi:hypothetical protein
MKRPGFHVSVSPHLHSGYTLQKMMFDTIAALIPVFFAGWFFFGWAAVKIVVACAAAAFITEFLWQKWISPPVRVWNGSAILTGMLLGFLLSTLIPLWLAVLGAFLAIVVGRHLFGGLGNHPFNAALVGWAFVSVSYNALMGDFALPEPAFLLEPGQFLAYPPSRPLKNWVPAKFSMCPGGIISSGMYPVPSGPHPLSLSCSVGPTSCTGASSPGTSLFLLSDRPGFSVLFSGRSIPKLMQIPRFISSRGG